ncbi:MAG: hypothetical protein JM58_16990 [Peptococcaceae bacterium BICA1-8]|nr:MAG: hypothetical protein JM58_16990 [Peptococcaceae bacterium BICA1-8]
MRKNIFYSFLTVLAVAMTIAMILYPQSTFRGATFGLTTWATVLIPALLPFFIISNILVELGIVNFLGILLEPLMRPLFKQPGASGFVLAMGFTSGFPMGAVLTNTLFEKNLVTKDEASRLIAFTNNSSPLFLLVAIPIGMFNNPNLGLILLLAHYIANLTLGIFLGLTKKSSKNLDSYHPGNLLKRSWQELLTFQKNSKAFGALLVSSVNKSIQNILMIGGFVIFFAVLIEILKETCLFYILSLFFYKILHFTGINPGLSEAVTIGFFEMTLGTQKASQINAALTHQLMIVSLILGWSGLSIQAQVTSIAARNNIPIGYYIFGRFFQGILSLIFTLLFYYSLGHISPVGNFEIFQREYFSILDLYYINFIACLSILIILIILSSFIKIAKTLKPRL